MTIDLQFKIKNNPYYQRYLKEHSYWYKMLNRDPSTFQAFIEEVKDTYQLRPSDRFTKMLETFEIMQSLMSNLQ